MAREAGQANEGGDEIPKWRKGENKVAEVEKSECLLRKSRLGQEDAWLSRGLLQVRSC